MNEPKDYARMWLDGGGDPTFDQIDGFLLRHFNARAVYVGDVAAMQDETHTLQRWHVANLLLTWAETTHGNEFGHDHHCPHQSVADRKKGPWADEVATTDHCTCGWAPFRVAYDAMQKAIIAAKEGGS